MEKSFYENFNQITQSIDGDHAQEHDLGQAMKWLIADQEYVKPEANTPPVDPTERAFFDGTIKAGAEEMIDSGIRDLSTAVFREHLNPAPHLSEEGKITQNQNRAYFETWLALKEQSMSGNVNKELTTNFLKAQKTFYEACKYHGDMSAQDRHKELLDKSLELTIDLSLDPRIREEELPFMRASINTLLARTLHDMASNQADIEMAIESLWDAHESIKEMNDGLLPKWAKDGLLAEIKYFRSLYSAQAGLSEFRRPSADRTELQNNRPQRTEDLGAAALRELKPPHAA